MSYSISLRRNFCPSLKLLSYIFWQLFFFDLLVHFYPTFLVFKVVILFCVSSIILPFLATDSSFLNVFLFIIFFCRSSPGRDYNKLDKNIPITNERMKFTALQSSVISWSKKSIIPTWMTCLLSRGRITLTLTLISLKVRWAFSRRCRLSTFWRWTRPLLDFPDGKSSWKFDSAGSLQVLIDLHHSHVSCQNLQFLLGVRSWFDKSPTYSLVARAKFWYLTSTTF